MSEFGTPRRRWLPIFDDQVVRIPLTKGAFAVIDLADLVTVAPFAWALHSSGYAVTQVERRQVYMHRLILGPDVEIADHVDSDRLNNRRANLRNCTRTENNRHRAPRPGSIKGAAFHRASGLYHATINVDGRQLSLGYYQTPEAAGAAYDAAAKDHHGDFAFTNAGAAQ